MNGPSQQGLEEVLGFAQQGGRIGAGLFPEVRIEGPRRIERDRLFSVSWQVIGTPTAVFTITDSQGRFRQEPVPAVGTRRLWFQEVGRYRLSVEAAPRAVGYPINGELRRELAIEVFAPPPGIELRVEPTAFFGSDVAVAWRVVDANAVFLLTDGEPLQVAAVGQHLIRFSACGSRTVKIVAAGPGGTNETERRVEVTAPPVQITVVERHEGFFGESVVIPYRVMNAETVTIRALRRNEPERQVASAGRITLEAGVGPARLELTAVGHDGRRVRKTVEVRVSALRAPSIADELRLLAVPVADAWNDFRGGHR